MQLSVLDQSIANKDRLQVLSIADSLALGINEAAFAGTANQVLAKLNTHASSLSPNTPLLVTRPCDAEVRKCFYELLVKVML